MRLLILLLLVTPFTLGAQKEDFQWIIGEDYNFNILGTNNMLLDFNNNKMQFEYVDKNIIMTGTNASICDSTGRLLLYSNGCVIKGASGDTLPNGDSLNVDYAFVEFCVNQGGYRGHDKALLLKSPGKPEEYYLFYMGNKYQYQPVYFAYVPAFSYSVVNTIDHDNMFVEQKNEVVLNDSLSGGQLEAVRHANGRDWWIIVPRRNTPEYFIFLFDKDGLHLVRRQMIGKEATYSTTCSQAAFSPDGALYARYGSPDGLFLFDFDRCEGLLSNFRDLGGSVDIFDCNCSGLSFSPNSRYLYLSLCDLYQYDMWSGDPAGERITVGVHDENDYESYFVGSQSGPDGKIYFITGNGTLDMHVVHDPDAGGLACRAERNAIRFDWPKFDLPNFPHFRLGSVDGSVCDSLSIDNLPWAHWRWEADTAQSLLAYFRDLSAYEPAAWHWDFGDPASGASNGSTERHPTHVFSTDGSYAVCLRVNNAYGADTLCRTVTVGSSAMSAPWYAEGEAALHPNPAGAYTALQLSHPLPQEGVLELLSPAGRVALRRELARGTAVARVELSGLPAGLYFWRLLGRGGRVEAAGRLVKGE